MRALPHSGHDFGHLLERWETIAKRGDLLLSILCEEGGLPVLVLENESAASGATGGLYLSAGVHGDECAPVWALLRWIEAGKGLPRDCPLVLFPCLNPHGLLENSRRDHRGVDLNRSFHDTAHPLVEAWQAWLGDRRFDLSVNLHEDFDATGIYLYELNRGAPLGERLLAACESHLPRETAALIDGSDFHRGHLVRGAEIARVVEEQLAGGFPEAIHLFQRHAEISLTFETPSEADLTSRIAVHQAFLEALISDS